MAPLRGHPFRDSSTPTSWIWASATLISYVVSLILITAFCACCKKQKEKVDDASKVGKLIDSKKAPDVHSMPPRQALQTGALSACAFSFASNLYRWCTSAYVRQNVVAFPIAVQVSFGPYCHAAIGRSRTQLRAILLPMISEKESDDILKTLATSIAPTAFSDAERNWRMATRFYAPQKQIDQFCPKYLQDFESLKEQCGKTMEIVGFTDADMKKSAPILDEANAWAKRNVHFLERPLYEKGEKKKKIFFLNRTDPRLVLLNVCGFRSRLEHPFRSADTSKIGHPFLCYDGRNLVRNLPMLHSNEEDETKTYYCFFEDDECQILRLPLKRNVDSKIEMAIYFLLPKERGALRTFEKSIGPNSLIGKIRKCNQPEHVRIVLPQIRVERRYTNLADGMKTLGARSVFDPKLAELAYMITPEGGQKSSSDKAKSLIEMGKSSAKQKASKLHDTENLCVTDVIHAGVFQLLDDSSDFGEPSEPSKTASPTRSIIGSQRSLPTKAVLPNKKTLSIITPDETNKTRSSSLDDDRKTISSKTPSAKGSTTNVSRESSTKGSKSTEASPTKSSTKESKTASESKSNKSNSSKASTTKSKISPSSSKNSPPTTSEKNGPTSIFARLMKSGSNRGSIKSDKGSDKSDRTADVPCPVCSRIEGRGVIPQLRRFVADHPFVWIVVIEKPNVIPLAIGRFCGTAM